MQGGQGRSTVGAIVEEFAETIIRNLWKDNISADFPGNIEQFKEKMLDMEEMWQFPCCWAAIDSLVRSLRKLFVNQQGLSVHVKCTHGVIGTTRVAQKGVLPMKDSASETESEIKIAVQERLDTLHLFLMKAPVLNKEDPVSGAEHMTLGEETISENPCEELGGTDMTDIQEDKFQDRNYKDNLIGRKVTAVYENTWCTGTIFYFNSVLKEYKVGYVDKTSDYLSYHDFDGIEVILEPDCRQ
ncbi:hypothetical protein ACROYT_G021831 [Oculina patagonica]